MLRNVALAFLIFFASIRVAAEAQAQDPYEINLILPVTGGLAFVGKTQIEALNILQEYVNKNGGIRGRPVKFTVADDQTNPQTAVQLTNQLLAKKVPLFAGSSLSAMCNAMAPLVKDGPVMYCFSPSIRPVPGSFEYSGDFSSDDNIKVAVRYLRLRGIRKLAVLSGTDATGQDADKGVDEALHLSENGSVSLVAFEHFNLSDISVRAQLARIKASGAQAIVSYSSGTALAMVLHGLADEGLDVPFVTSPANMSYAQLQQYKSFIPSQLIFPGHAWLAPEFVTDPRLKRSIRMFTDAFRAAGLQRPDKIQALTWDVCSILVDSLRRLGLNATPVQIRNDIDSVRGWYGVLGVYDFRAVPQRGLAPGSITMERWDPEKELFTAISRPGGEPLH
jgi:branched-chain amino acid transport system substrate-binding protein